MRRCQTVMLCLSAAPAMATAQMAPRDAVAATTAEKAAPVSRVPQWLTVGGQLRVRGEAYNNGGFRPDNSDQYLLTRALLSARVRPSRTTSLFVEGMDSRGPWKNAAPLGPPFRDYVDLRQLYFQVGAEKSANMVRAGRLELAFGDSRLVGTGMWANTPRTFDGARATFAGKGYRVDAFAASVVRIVQDRFDKTIPGNNFYGVYSSITKLLPDAAVEPFFFWRRQSGLATELSVPGTMNFGTAGLRAVGKLPARFDYDTQLAAQRGSLGDESIRGWAAHGVVGYTLAGMRATPRLFAEYNQASGDANPTDNKKGTFDQLYPSGHDKLGLTDLVGWQNIRHLRTGVELSIPRSWVVSARYNRYSLDDAHDALYSGGGAVIARSATGVAGTDAGQEWDFIASGKIMPTLGFSTGLGYFKPGTFLRTTTPGKPYTYPYAMLTYDF